MKLIITESQKDEALKNLIRTQGWEFAARVVGGNKFLLENIFNYDPYKFMDIYKGMESAQCIEDPDFILYRVKEGNNLMVKWEDKNTIYFHWDNIWTILNEQFELSHGLIEGVLNKWVSESYGLENYRIKRVMALADGGWLATTL